MQRKLFLLILFTLSSLSSEEFGKSLNLRIIESKSNKNVSWTEVLTAMDEADVLVWGEEHDDTQGHSAQIEFFKKFSDQFPVSLSLEMLERDQQNITDEYYRGLISEKQFLSSINHWKNFSSDYLPLVRYAKESFSNIICANPPRRYVNAISRKGIMAYSDFSDDAMRFLPHAYTLALYQSDPYLARLRDVFQSSPTNHTSSISTENMILSQYVWDQGMAESVTKEHFRTGRKILHINGRFHSDYDGGVVHRLKAMGHKVVVLSVFPEGSEEEAKFGKIADFVILTSRR
ncbi:MAG: ChaN family lipoprotein [Leptospira sp.]|nr:ChaN family lipoprotein [Leptospira sp.]